MFKDKPIYCATALLNSVIKLLVSKIFGLPGFCFLFFLKLLHMSFSLFISCYDNANDNIITDKDYNLLLERRKDKISSEEKVPFINILLVTLFDLGG